MHYRKLHKAHSYEAWGTGKIVDRESLSQEETLIMRWHRWGWNAKKILEFGQNVLDNFNTETKIKRVIRRNTDG